MAAAIRLCSGENAIETATFIEKMDKFFDCFNVSTFTAGKHQRKPFLAPYRSKTDFRLDVSNLFKKFNYLCMYFYSF